MKVRLYAALFLFALAAKSQDAPTVRFAGTAINMTNPDKPLAGPIEFIISHDGCKLMVSAPLGGSGNCVVKSFDEKSRQIEILSQGPPFIDWTATIKGNFASGTYKIDSLHQSGVFYSAVLKPDPPPPPLPPVREYVPPVPHSSCSPAIESSISGDFNGWEGETIFKLQNGQIWQQAEYDYEYDYDYSPDVTIYETTAGCRMKVEGEDETILVKRIK